MVAPSSFAVTLEPLTLTPWQTVHCHLHCYKHIDTARGAVVRDTEGASHASGNVCFPHNCKNWAGTPKLCVKMLGVQCLASGYMGMCDTGMFPCESHRLMACGWKEQGVCAWVVEVVF